MLKIPTFFIIVISIFALLLCGAVSASTSRGYILYLYFNKGTIVADRDYGMPYKVINEIYQRIPWAMGDYRGDILSMNGKVLDSFYFNPADDQEFTDGDNQTKSVTNLKFTKGKIVVNAPYYPNAKQIVFYSPSAVSILTIDVSSVAICNEDRVCNNQETSDSCPSDCVALTPKPVKLIVPAMESTSPSSTASAPLSKSNTNIVSTIIYLVAGGGLIAAGFVIRKRIQKKP